MCDGDVCDGVCVMEMCVMGMCVIEMCVMGMFVYTPDPSRVCHLLIEAVGGAYHAASGTSTLTTDQ